jgi:ThiF family
MDNKGIIILTEGKYTYEELEKVKKDYKIWKIKDIYKNQATELFEIHNPTLINTQEFHSKLNEFIEERCEPNAEIRGSWVYYRWSGVLLHMLGKEDHLKLRTNRTRNLVTIEEQGILSNFNVGVAGLSFGNGIVLALAYGGFSNNIKIADSDRLETTNLNRMRIGLENVGELKTEVTKREIYEINPYAEIVTFQKGLTKENLNEFVQGSPKLNVIFDVVDDFTMKVMLRLAAREARIPVIMLTSLGDSVLVDLERYDLEPERELFHGLLGRLPEEILSNTISEKDKVRYAMSIVGPENVSVRNMLSLSEIGYSLVSRPHLYSTVSVVCGLAGYLVKGIALNKDFPSFRKHLVFNEILGLSADPEDSNEERSKILEELAKRVDL